MALESLKHFLYNLLSHFGIENGGENERSQFFGQTLTAQCASISPDGSSVDPEPLLKLIAEDSDTSLQESAEIASVKDSSQPAAEGTSEEIGKTALKLDAVDTPANISEDWSKFEAGSECKEQVSSEASTETPHDYEAGVDNVLPKSSQCADSLSVSQELNTTTTDTITQLTTEEVTSASCDPCNDETDYLIPAVPSTDFYGRPSPPTKINGEECILHRLIPKLSSRSLNSAGQGRAQVRTRGKVTFNSPLFSEGDFELRILHEKVCLEFIQIDSNVIHGYVRVLNTTYVKDVTVYYTKNDWKIVRTKKAEWVETVSNGTMDRFVFTIPGRQSVGQLSFSIKFNGILDDNKGHNYTVAYERV